MPITNRTFEIITSLPFSVFFSVLTLIEMVAPVALLSNIYLPSFYQAPVGTTMCWQYPVMWRYGNERDSLLGHGRCFRIPHRFPMSLPKDTILQSWWPPRRLRLWQRLIVPGLICIPGSSFNLSILMLTTGMDNSNPPLEISGINGGICGSAVRMS